MINHPDIPTPTSNIVKLLSKISILQRAEQDAAWETTAKREAHLAADHDVRDFGFAVTAVRLVVSCAH